MMNIVRQHYPIQYERCHKYKADAEPIMPTESLLAIEWQTKATSQKMAPSSPKITMITEMTEEEREEQRGALNEIEDRFEETRQE